MSFQKPILVLFFALILPGICFAQYKTPEEIDFSTDPQFGPYKVRAISQMRMDVEDATLIMDNALNEIQYASSDDEIIRILENAQRKALEHLYVDYNYTQLLGEDCTLHEMIDAVKDRANNFVIVNAPNQPN